MWHGEFFCTLQTFLLVGWNSTVGFFGCGHPVTIFVMSWDDGVCVMAYWKMMATSSRYNITRSITLYLRAFWVDTRPVVEAIYQPAFDIYLNTSCSCVNLANDLTLIDSRNRIMWWTTNGYSKKTICLYAAVDWFASFTNTFNLTAGYFHLTNDKFGDYCWLTLLFLWSVLNSWADSHGPGYF